NIKGQYVASPLPRGAGITLSLVKADGLLRIPANVQGYEEGTRVEVELYKPKEVIDRTLLVVGSHDLTLDLLGTVLKQKNPEVRFISSHVGSLGGLLALKAGTTHLAGLHLFDEVTETYNIPYVEKYLANKRVVLINLAYRMQGWMVQKGNPEEITGLEDIASRGLPIINRQKGSGTRILLDHLLKKGGISPNRIQGYNREEYTHLTVAAAVASGSVKAGIGIYSAAKLYSLDFIPICEERYDLLMEESFYQSDFGTLVLEAMESKEFKERVESLGGYSMRDTSQVLYRT
ncbi:MAG: substrate-binding domain-containing protein, partial [Spirochaetales bacterium]